MALVPDYKINLIAPGRMDDADFGKFKTTLAEAFQYIKYSKDKTALQQVLHENKKFTALDRRTAELINVVTGSNLEFKKGEGSVNMCIAIEEIKKESIAEGMEKGIAKGSEEKELSTIKKLMEKLQYTAEQAMTFLDIPKEKQDIYLKRL
jgi:hypothetical protein